MNLCPKCRSDWCSCKEYEESLARMQVAILKPMDKSPLSRGEKLSIISSVVSGIGDKALFCEDVLRERIKTCLKIAEELL